MRIVAPQPPPHGRAANAVARSARVTYYVVHLAHLGRRVGHVHARYANERTAHRLPSPAAYTYAIATAPGRAPSVACASPITVSLTTLSERSTIPTASFGDDGTQKFSKI